MNLKEVRNNIELITHEQYQHTVPKSGHHILAQQTNDEILVYQAFNPSIANFAIENQYFGGNSYRYSRMSWIKPNFLWMMYRCGWAEKVNQEKVLGIWLKKEDFDTILQEAVYSSYQEAIYGTHENWKSSLSQREVRLQWDPDHNIYGQKEERRAIQLGIKGDLLKRFAKSMTTKIIDMTPFVKEQKALIDTKKIEQLLLPKETTYTTQNDELNQRLRIG